MPTDTTSPFRLNLEQQKKRARELQRAVRAQDPAAVARFRTQHPKAGSLADEERGRLGEAQLVIARELGLPSWPRLKEHIAALEEAGRGTAALDAECRTLHIRCGWDIRASLQAGRFAGDFLEYSDPLCQGPVVLDGAFPSRRAAFLVQAYDLDPQEAADKLQQQEAALLRAAEAYERIVLWSEHDSYDQLVLIRLLAQFAERRPRQLDLIGVKAFPGNTRFIGLGQLPPEAFRLLWQRRKAVTEAQLALGREAWQALASPDPSVLADLAQGGTPALPDLAPALRRHLAELPDRRSGLGLTQRLTLEILRDAPRSIGQVFAELMRHREPLPWLGDLMFWAIVREMRRVSDPPFLLEGGEAWPQLRATLTETGRRLLDGELDWLSLTPPERWVGGVHIAGPDNWRWDEEAQRPTRKPSPLRKRGWRRQAPGEGGR